MSQYLETLILDSLTSDPGSPVAGQKWYNSTDGVFKEYRGGAVRVINDRKVNASATTDPTTTDDSSSGYEVGSLWVNTTSDAAFICVDATASAAVWVAASGQGSSTSYGAIYEDDDSGTNEIVISPPNEWEKWATSTAGAVAGAPYVTADTTNDRLVIGAGGGGTYAVFGHAAVELSGNSIVHMRLRKNGTEVEDALKTFDQKSTGQRLDLDFSGLVSGLVENDYLELWFSATSNNTTITIYYINLTVFRIQGAGGGGGPDADAIHDNVSGEISAVTEKTTPVSGDLLLIEDSAASNAKKKVQIGNLPGGGGSSAPPYGFDADQLLSPNNADWKINALAPLSADSNNAALLVRLFDDTTEEGVGFQVRIPTGVTNMKIKLISRAETAPAGARTVGAKLYNRGMPGTVETWSAGNALADLDIPTSENWQYDEETLSLATLGATADELTQFELTRIDPSAGTELSGDWALLWLGLEFS